MTEGQIPNSDSSDVSSSDDVIRVPPPNKDEPKAIGADQEDSLVQESGSDEVVVRSYFHGEKQEDAPMQARVESQPDMVGTSLPPDPPPPEPTHISVENGTQSIPGQTVKVDPGDAGAQKPVDKSRPRKQKNRGASCGLLIGVGLVIFGLTSLGVYLAWQNGYFDLALIDDVVAQLTPKASPTEDEHQDSMVATPAPTQGSGVLIEPSPVGPTSTPAIGVTRVLDTAQAPEETAGPTVTQAAGQDEGGESEINGATMVYVPGGTFTMGAGSAARQRAHQVTLSAYFIDKYEVTNLQWAACFSAGNCGLPVSTDDYTGAPYYGEEAFDNYPVVYITWTQADAYCKWRDAHLPTEAEWEMAARWDPETGDVTAYPWGDSWDPENANYCDSSCLLTQYASGSFADGWPQMAPVGSFPAGASALGLLDMAGNVAEWVADWFSATYYGISPPGNPTGPTSGVYKVVRGGAWGVGDPQYLTGHARSAFTPNEYNPGLGFRCAVSADQVDR